MKRGDSDGPPHQCALRNGARRRRPLHLPLQQHGGEANCFFSVYLKYAASCLLPAACPALPLQPRLLPVQQRSHRRRLRNDCVSGRWRGGGRSSSVLRCEYSSVQCGCSRPVSPQTHGNDCCVRLVLTLLLTLLLSLPAGTGTSASAASLCWTLTCTTGECRGDSEGGGGGEVWVER